jgi:hypothetical protein
MRSRSQLVRVVRRRHKVATRLSDRTPQLAVDVVEVIQPRLEELVGLAVALVLLARQLVQARLVKAHTVEFATARIMALAVVVPAKVVKTLLALAMDCLQVVDVGYDFLAPHMLVVVQEDTKVGLVGLVVAQAKQLLSHQAVQPGQPTLAVAAAVLSTITVERLVLAEQVAQVA